MVARRYGFVTTGDGVRIRYIDAGSGPILVLVPGFSQSAAEFGKQIDDLSHDYRVVAMDLRGHGESDRPEYGYRISRFARDLRELLDALNLREVTVLAHSLGCTVVWSYWDLFGGDLIKGLVLVDQGPIIAAELAEGDRAEELGALFTHEAASGLVAGLRGPDSASQWQALLESMHSSELSSVDRTWFIEQNALFPAKYAATLFLDYYGNDWRDVLSRITVPVLIIGGESSLFSPSVAKRVGAEIPGASVRIFSEAEKGSHLMFWENSELFNQIVREFLA